MGLKRSNVLINDALVVMAMPTTRGRFLTTFQLKEWAKQFNINLSMSQCANMLSRAKGLVLPTEYGWEITLVGLAYRDMVCDTLKRLDSGRNGVVTPPLRSR